MNNLPIWITDTGNIAFASPGVYLLAIGIFIAVFMSLLRAGDNAKEENTELGDIQRSVDSAARWLIIIVFVLIVVKLIEPLLAFVPQ